MFRKWRPSNQPTRYDRARLAQLEPIETEIKKLGLPLVRFRKLNGILNALEMQIEDSGDSPEVNSLLLEALRAGIHHQVGQRRAKAALRAIDVFEQAEARRWEQVKAGTLPPIKLTSEEQLNDLMQEGYELLLGSEQRAVACDRWLEAWKMIKQMATPEMRTVSAFDEAYPGLFQSVYNWCSDLEMELDNAGIDDAVYHEHRLRYASDFLAQFADEDAGRTIQFMRAAGEALWHLGRREEAGALYTTLVERLPDEGWAYIGWSDNYWLGGALGPEAYDKAEAILRRALTRPNLRDRADVLDRLADLYTEWGKPEELGGVIAQPEQIETPSGLTPDSSPAAPPPTSPPLQPSPLAAKAGRNDPCWCGSGKKYKHCHLRSDQRAAHGRSKR